MEGAGENEDQTSSLSERGIQDEDKPPDANLPPITNEPAGLTAKGDWEQIRNFCDYFTYILEKEYRKENLSVNNLEEWKNWEPGEGEDQNRCKKKTASQAAFQPQSSPGKEYKKSATQLNSFQQNIKDGKNKKAVHDLITAVIRGLKGFLTHAGEVVGDVEYLIYRYLTTKTNPSYFDNGLLSANLERLGSLLSEEDEKYKIQIKIHDENIRKRISQKLLQ